LNLILQMIESHIDNEVLKTKILTLFDYRLFPTLIDLVEKTGTEFDKSSFIQQLIDLQTSIYHLDAHLEAHWETRADVLAWHWTQIKANLLRLGNLPDDIDQYINHIRIYERHELGLRQNKDLLRLNLSYFYFYKSCDVKLLRRLIYERGKLTNAAGSLSDWRYYDLITELNDDVEDVFEDLDFINGNVVLIYLIKHGKDKTSQHIETFIDEIEKKAHEQYKSKKHHDMKEYIYKTTLQRISETRDLLQTQIQAITIEDLSQSKLHNTQMYQSTSI
jgi:hypothetical protein